MNKKLKEQGKNTRECVYRFIVKYISDNGYAPSVCEICKSVGLKSTSSVHSHLVKLQIEGRIEIKPYCKRAIRVIKN